MVRGALRVMGLRMLCLEYRQASGHRYADDWLAELGLPEYCWWGPAGTDLLSLRSWRRAGRYADPPLLRCEPGDLSVGLVVLAARALEDAGRPVPEELTALAALGLAEGLVRWVHPPGEGT